MFIGVKGREVVGYFFEQLAAAVIGFPAFNPLPGHIERRQPGKRVGEPFLAIVAVGQQPGQKAARAEESDIEDDAVLVRIIEFCFGSTEELRRLEIRGAGVIHQRDPDVIEVLTGARIHQRFPLIEAHRRKTWTTAPVQR